MPGKIRKLKAVWENRNIYNQFAIYKKESQTEEGWERHLKGGSTYGIYDSVSQATLSMEFHNSQISQFHN